MDAVEQKLSFSRTVSGIPDDIKNLFIFAEGFVTDPVSIESGVNPNKLIESGTFPPLATYDDGI
jgi:hypothetical protein